MKIAIIGAGMTAMSIAQNLEKNINITIFEKSKGVGGRMSLRREGPYEFDHGAQFFTAKSKEFINFISPLKEKKVIKQWNARFAEFKNNKLVRKIDWDQEYPHYVGSPGMNSISKYLSKDLNIKLNTRIYKITKSKNNGWQLYDHNSKNLGYFDWVISTAPAIQSSEILPKEFKYHKDLLDKKMKGCFSLMLGFKEALPLTWDAALIREADISWISVNSSKPDRNKSFSLLVHSTNNWAENHLSDNKNEVISYLISETSRVIGHDVREADHTDIHAWRYANIEKQSEIKPFIDYENKLISCGDWLIQGRIESAFRSGLIVAKEITKILSNN